MNYLLNKFIPVSLNQLSSLELPTRVESKFVFTQKELPQFLDLIPRSIGILAIDNQRQFTYSNQYFDTAAFHAYFAHHNGKGNRAKFRIRQYGNSEPKIAEVKLKNNNGQTLKERKPIASIAEALSFFKEHNSYAQQLNKVVNITYDRITLIDTTNGDKFTIDYNLKCAKPNDAFEFTNVVITELKTARGDRNNIFYKSLKSMGIRKTSFSKYCMSLVYLTSQLKSNRFKPTLKLTNNLIA